MGKAKAKVFKAIGYTLANLLQLEEDLLVIARSNEPEYERSSPHGTKFIVRGTLSTPTGATVTVRTVWIIEPGDGRPRFVTAYPS